MWTLLVAKESLMEKILVNYKFVSLSTSESFKVIIALIKL